MGLCFVPFPGLSSSGDQVLGERTLPRCAVPLITSLVPACRFPGCAAPHHLRCAVCLLWGADLWLQPSWQISRVQEPRKTWEQLGACSQFGGGCRFWSQDCRLPSCSGCSPPASLPLSAGAGLVCSWLALFWYLLSPLFCVRARLCLRLEHSEVVLRSCSAFR